MHEKALADLFNEKRKAGDAALKGALEARSTAVECYIAAGQAAIRAKQSVDDYSEWVEKYCDVKLSQASKLVRIATHKEESRRLFHDGEAGSINALQKVLPKTSEAPEEEGEEADVDNLAYVGTKPGETRNSDDWQTPSVFIEAARTTMGSIDLDPFSSELANAVVCADRYFTEEDNSLDREWGSTDTRTCWMNPPYSRGASAKAVEKFLEQYDVGAFDQGVVLMNSSTDTNWFHRMAGVATAICFTKGRISFEDGGGKKKSGNTKGQVFFYFGRKAKTFKRVFSEHGLVLMTENV